MWYITLKNLAHSWRYTCSTTMLNQGDARDSCGTSYKKGWRVSTSKLYNMSNYNMSSCCFSCLCIKAQLIMEWINKQQKKTHIKEEKGGRHSLMRETQKGGVWELLFYPFSSSLSSSCSMDHKHLFVHMPSNYVQRWRKKNKHMPSELCQRWSSLLIRPPPHHRYHRLVHTIHVLWSIFFPAGRRTKVPRVSPGALCNSGRK